MSLKWTDGVPGVGLYEHLVTYGEAPYRCLLRVPGEWWQRFVEFARLDRTPPGMMVSDRGYLYVRSVTIDGCPIDSGPWKSVLYDLECQDSTIRGKLAGCEFRELS